MELTIDPLHISIQSGRQRSRTTFEFAAPAWVFTQSVRGGCRTPGSTRTGALGRRSISRGPARGRQVIYGCQDSALM